MKYVKASRGFSIVIGLVFVFAMMIFANSAPLEVGIDEEVHRLIQEMPRNAVTQRSSIDGLRKVGNAGIPYIVKYLEDMRELPEQRMVIAPPPSMDSRMPARQVNVTRVASALMWILEELTGKSFGQYLYEFEVKTREELSISQWRKWCSETWPDKADVCWGKQ